MERMDKQISREEMLQMRENGMTNMEIARSLDISYATVHRYIGSQPQGLRAAYGSVVAYVHSTPQEPEKENKKPLIMEMQVTNYSGEFARYKVISTGSVEIIDGPAVLKKKELEAFIVELMSVYEAMGCEQIGNAGA